MAATIKIKNSSTAGAAPTSSDLVQGELAVNVTDKRLYTENASGTIVELGTNPSVPVTFPDGSASAPSLTNDGDTNTGLFFPAADTVGIATGGTERARVDSSGNLGLGVTPSAWGSGFKAIEFTGGTSITSDGTAVQLTSNGYYNGSTWIYKNSAGVGNYYINNNTHVWRIAGSGTAGNAITFTQAMTLDASGNLGVGTTSPFGTAAGRTVLSVNGTTDVSLNVGSGGTQRAYLYGSSSLGQLGTIGALPLVFATNDTERARIDTSGNLLVGTTSGSGKVTIKGGNGTQLYLDNAGEQFTQITYHNNGTAKAYNWWDQTNTRFQIQAGGSGGVYLANNGTSWTSASDERVKDIIEPIENATEKLSNWRTVIGKYKTDEDGTRRSFLIAQDVLQTFPEAVDTTNADEFGLSYQDTIPVLVKAIQEQQAIIEQLQADVAALKG